MKLSVKNRLRSWNLALVKASFIALPIGITSSAIADQLVFQESPQITQKRLEICTAVFYEYLGEDEPVTVEECLNNKFEVTRENARGVWFYFLGQAGPWGRLMECELVNTKPLNQSQPIIENCREIQNDSY